MTEIRPGQLWADNDPRSRGRVIQVTRHDLLGEVHVVTVRNSRTAINDNIGRRTKINAARFVPTTKGYVLIQDEHGQPRSDTDFQKVVADQLLHPMHYRGALLEWTGDLEPKFG